MSASLGNIRRAIFAACCAFLLVLTGILLVDKMFPFSPESEYVPPAGVKVVAGAGPLDCDFSKVEGPVLTGVVPRYQRPSLKVQIPRGYLKNPITGGQQGADGTVLMFMSIDTFLADRKPYGSSPSDDDLMMLIWDAAAPNEIFQNMAQSYQVDVSAAEKQNEGLVTMKSRHGEKDLSVSKYNNNINDLIFCDSPDSVPFPGCQHHFRFQTVDVQLNYRRSQLRDWKAIRGRSEQFLQCIISHQLD